MDINLIHVVAYLFTGKGVLMLTLWFIQQPMVNFNERFFI